MALYHLRMIGTDGSISEVTTTFTSLQYSKTVNTPGALSLSFLEGDDDIRADLFKEDMRIQVWRTPDSYNSAYLDLDAVWFVTGNVISIGADKRRTLAVSAKSALDLAARRIVTYSTSSPQATVSGKADDMMKRLILENLGASAAGRIIPGLSVQSNASLGATVNKQVGWRNVLSSVQEIARDSEANGTELYFDIVANGPAGEMEFRTWVGQPGTVRTHPVISLESGALRSASWGFSNDDKVNIVYGLGQEQNGVRNVQAAVDPSYAATPFSRREVPLEARTGVLGSEILAEANAEMARKKPKDTVVAEIANSNVAQYGVHWNYGDRLTISVQGRRYDCLVEGVQVSTTKLHEEVKATLRF